LSVCGGDGTCLVRSWCALPGRSTSTDLSDTLSDAKYEVIARLKPNGKQKIYSNYKSSAEGQSEVCINCRFKPNSVLNELQDKPENVASVGLELEHTFHWQCDDAQDDRYGCNVWTDQTVTRHEFSVSRSTAPVARGDDGELMRRTVTFYGMNIHFKGEGYLELVDPYPILMMICQLIALIMVAGMCCFSVLFSGGHPRTTAFEPYPETVEQKLWEVVRLKQEANPELKGVNKQRLYQRTKEDVQIMSGLGAQKSSHDEKVNQCLEALKRNNGSSTDAATELEIDAKVVEEVKVGSGHESLKSGIDRAAGSEDTSSGDGASTRTQESV